MAKEDGILVLMDVELEGRSHAVQARDQDTANIIKKYEGHNIDILTFNQSKYTAILKDSSLFPAPKNSSSQISDWYPPGHGDVFESLERCWGYGSGGGMEESRVQNAQRQQLQEIQILQSSLDLIEEVSRSRQSKLRDPARAQYRTRSRQRPHGQDPRKKSWTNPQAKRCSRLPLLR
jgi:hypothetical protein